MGNHSFLYRIIEDLLLKDSDLSKFNIVLPGKRPIVFIKRILEEKQYSGVLPNFYTIEDIISKLSEKQLIQGVALWLFAFEIYKNNFEEDFSNFLKWFPVLQKDWDDILKFADNEKKVLGYMFDEERIKNWGEGLGEPSETRKRNLDFWKKMNVFLPKLKKALGEKNLATSGMIHEEVRAKIESFAQQTDEKFVFCGFNALTPMEEKMIKKLLQWDKAICYFQADEYYMNDEKQEAGKFLRKYKNWKEFNDNRVFSWIDNRFSKGKNIQVFEVSGNVT
ncbi:MAG: PD-(D/E)XK nuclease family protein, partial [Bergeyella zoohelcum]|nr:PD-(D/E)XK nuclease family protein [Bergeyella zoohelcum]